MKHARNHYALVQNISFFLQIRKYPHASSQSPKGTTNLGRITVVGAGKGGGGVVWWW